MHSMVMHLRAVVHLAVVFSGLTPAAVWAQGYLLRDAASKMTLAPGLRAKLFAGEPQIRQPILVKCDDRGRLWVIQYLQYPNPAGLKRVKVDRHSRTVYDRVPEPPPRGPRGEDRITICEDADGDGVADKFHDFVSGLNLCTGLAFGHGGVFVMQVPYLLFYPDRNGDDVPDGDPEVLLSGFGMEDAQSLANHLTWGPDGWLYGVNGSTTTCKIRGIEFQQGAWRYHPITKEFELFCEGGGNTFGVTFDEHGNLFYSTNGGPCIHAIQGAYYYKSFGKHGPLHNPYAYGFLNHVKYDQISLGPPTGGTIYLGDQLPETYRGSFLAGDFLGHSASSWKLQPAGGTFTASYRGKFLDSNDTWFGATDLCIAPDGSLYLSDFCDKRTAHPDPDADWDRSNGRVYRISAAGSSAALPKINLSKLDSNALVELLDHRNHWYRERARVHLASRNDHSVLPRLRTMARQTANQDQAREALWALATIGRGAWNDSLADELLKHPSEDVRAWVVRLLGDRRQVTAAQGTRLADLARSEHSPRVRQQLAATAKRLPAPIGLVIAKQMLMHHPDYDDSDLGLLLWWAVEDKAIAQANNLIDFVTSTDRVETGWIRRCRSNLMRRFAADGTAAGDAAALRFLQTAGRSTQDLEALSQGLAERAVGLPAVGQGDLYKGQALPVDPAIIPGRSSSPPSAELRAKIIELWKTSPKHLTYLRLALQVDHAPARQTLASLLTEPEEFTHRKLEVLEVALQHGHPDLVPAVLPLLGTSDANDIRTSVLKLLGQFPTKAGTAEILRRYPDLPRELQAIAHDVLFSRVDSAREFLTFIEHQPKRAAEIPVEQVRRIALLNDDALNIRVRKLWGNIQPGTSEEKLAEMRRFNNDLRAGLGDVARGRTLFLKHCGICHRMNNEGTPIGPDLNIAARGERDALLAHIVDPSSVIRSQYLAYVVHTVAGTVHTGLIADQDAASITLLDSRNQRTRLLRSQIEEMNESTTSLMPERLLNELMPQERRDLFSYLQKR